GRCPGVSAMPNPTRATAGTPAAPGPGTRPGRRGAAWRRFLRHRLAAAGAAVVALLVLTAILAPVLAPYDPLAQDDAAVLQPPSGARPLGTDGLGRAVLSRLIYGARLSILAGLISVGIALAIGLPIGLIAGYVGGFWDEVVIMRLTDAMM